MKTLIKQKTAQHFIVFMSAWYCGILWFMPNTLQGLNLFNFLGITLCLVGWSVVVAMFIEGFQAHKSPGTKPSTFDIVVSAAGALTGTLLHHFYPSVLVPYFAVIGGTIAFLQAMPLMGYDSRKFLVRWWFLDYSVKIFRHGRSVRASLTIFPLMVINGLFVAFDELNPWAFSALAVALWFGFVYGRIHPITVNDWPRMTDYQKWQWGYYVRENDWFDEFRAEWIQLDGQVDEWLDEKKIVL